MYIVNVINIIKSDIDNLKKCYSSLKYSGIENNKLAESIFMLEEVVSELKNNSKTVEEINGIGNK